MKAFFSHTISAVRVNGELTDWFMEQQKFISKGVTLQCESSRVEEKHILDTDYVDDMALLDNTEEGLQETTDLVCKYSAYAGLKINAGKTKCMAVIKCASQRPYCRKDTLDISVEGLPIEQVSNFTYLGVIISADGTKDKELSSRIQKASGAFYQLSRIWYSRNIKTPTKVRIYKAGVLTILLYGSEVWYSTQVQMKRFEVFQQRCLRRILKIRWNYFVSNAEVLRRANIAPVAVHIRAARLRWFGHVVIMPEERVPNYFLDWIPMHGKRSRGRPRKNWLSCVLEDAASFIIGVDNISLEAAKQHASDRVHWKNLIHRNKELLCGAGHSND